MVHRKSADRPPLKAKTKPERVQPLRETTVLLAFEGGRGFPRNVRKGSKEGALPNKSGTEHKRHKKEHKRHKKNQLWSLSCASCVPFCASCVPFPIYWVN